MHEEQHFPSCAGLQAFPVSVARVQGQVDGPLGTPCVVALQAQPRGLREAVSARSVLSPKGSLEGTSGRAVECSLSFFTSEVRLTLTCEKRNDFVFMNCFVLF